MADVLKNPAETTFERLVTPDADVFQNDSGYLVIADVPGATRDGVELKVEDRRLTLEGPLGDNTGFHREFQLPRDVDTNAIHAELTDGVLTLTLPKLEASRPRRIEIG